MERHHCIPTWLLTTVALAIVGATTTSVHAVEPEPTPTCDDACMAEVEAFCASPTIAPYDAIGDCEADIVANTVPSTLAPAIAPSPSVAGGTVQETLALEL